MAVPNGSPADAWFARIPAHERALVDRIIRNAAPKEKRGVVYNEGFRFVCLGESGSGKTSLMRLVVYYTVAKGWSGFALIHDTKGIEAEYPRSLQYASVEPFRKQGFKAGQIPIVSFRGDPRRDLTVSAEDVARFSKELGQKGRIDSQGRWVPNPHILVIEELAAAATGGRKHVSAPSVLWALEQGRKVGVSIVGTTQSPRKIPLDILEQAEAVAFFRLTLGANYLGERLHLQDDMIRAIAGPNGEGLPNHQFVLWIKGEPWDGKIYSLDKRTALMFE